MIELQWQAIKVSNVLFWSGCLHEDEDEKTQARTAKRWVKIYVGVSKQLQLVRHLPQVSSVWKWEVESRERENKTETKIVYNEGY